MATTTGLVQQVKYNPVLLSAMAWIGPSPANTTVFYVIFRRGDSGAALAAKRSLAGALVRAQIAAVPVTVTYGTDPEITTATISMPPTPGKWIGLGPTLINDGGLGSIGRIHSIAVHPTTPSTIYAGAHTCGIWKTTNGGGTWAPVGDSLPTLALAALAVDPVTPTRVYAVLGGTGIYRSNDSASTWTQISGDLGTPAGAGVLLIDPTTPSTMYLTAGANGLYRSVDSGVNWIPIKTGAVDVAMVPSSPTTLYAGVPGIGVFKTTSANTVAGDSGWTQLTGLPADGFGRVTVALCAAAPNNVYAGVSGGSAAFRLYRSSNGASLSLQYQTPANVTGFYNPWIGVDPANPAIVYVLSAQFFRSTDSGMTIVAPSGDLHECQKFAVDPVTPGVIYVGRDNGLFRSADRGLTFSQIGGGMANVEIYDGAVAPTAPSLMLVGTQDNGTLKYPNSPTTVWTEISGGDGATVAFDPTNAQILYAMGQYADSIRRSTDGGMSFAGYSAGLPGNSSCGNLEFFVHPTTPTTLLACCTSLWRITSPTGTWSTIFTPMTGGVVRAAVDGSVNLYYAGASDGKLYAGAGGTSFQQVFAHPLGAGFSRIRVDPANPTVVYATFGGKSAGRVYRLQRSSPTPASLTATDITGNLPAGPAARCIAIDRNAPFTVYVGTDRGVYRGVSTNGGATFSWSSYNNGFPLWTVSSIEVHPTTGVMRASTLGRSAYEVYTA